MNQFEPKHSLSHYSIMDVHDDSKLLKINDPFFFYISEISRSSLMNSSYLKSLDASIYIYFLRKRVFSYITTVELSNPGDLRLIQYFYL